MSCPLCGTPTLGRRYCSTLCRSTAERERDRKRDGTRTRTRNPAYWKRKRARKTARARAKRQANPAWQAWRVEVEQRKRWKAGSKQRGEARRREWAEHAAALAAEREERRRESGWGEGWNKNIEYQIARRAYRWKNYRGSPGHALKRQHDRERNAKRLELFRALRDIGWVKNNEILTERPPPKLPKPRLQARVRKPEPLTDAVRARRNASRRTARAKQRAIIEALRERGWLKGLEIVPVSEF